MLQYFSKPRPAGQSVNSRGGESSYSEAAQRTQTKCRINPGTTIMAYPMQTTINQRRPLPTLPRYICPAPGIIKLSIAATPRLGPGLAICGAEGGAVCPLIWWYVPDSFSFSYLSSSSRNSPQYRHFFAVDLIVSLQYGHSVVVGCRAVVISLMSSSGGSGGGELGGLAGSSRGKKICVLHPGHLANLPAYLLEAFTLFPQPAHSTKTGMTAPWEESFLFSLICTLTKSKVGLSETTPQPHSARRYR